MIRRAPFDCLGCWATQKVEIDGKRYQCQFQMVEIGSKQKKE